MQENIPVEEVFEQLRCTKEGLTDEDGEARLKIFGQNKLEEKSVLLCFPLLILRLDFPRAINFDAFLLEIKNFLGSLHQGENFCLYPPHL